MLLLGVVQAQVTGAPAGAGSYDLLATEILTSSAASVTFSSLGDYAGTYQHLQLRIVAKSTRADDLDYFALQFNADTGNNYATHVLRGISGSVSSFAETSQSRIITGRLAGGNTTDSFGAAVIDILDPFETTKNTTTRGLGGVRGGSGAEISLASGVWLNTDALTSILVKPDNGSAEAESRFSLYGLRNS